MANWQYIVEVDGKQMTMAEAAKYVGMGHSAISIAMRGYPNVLCKGKTIKPIRKWIEIDMLELSKADTGEVVMVGTAKEIAKKTYTTLDTVYRNIEKGMKRFCYDYTLRRAGKKKIVKEADWIHD